ncbi:MAG: anhydro-N-acetylmuramic acid kinase [Sphingobacteriales bacterium JAD_PAG50586_3]|nr:MAG: anhydro-N-acetylmuramic acid kinase [Sphingobacteriales bacterium JAD_PAG50586_3]
MNKDTYKVIGLMSGSSLDGLDVAYCEFTHTEAGWKYAITAAETVEYSDYWEDQLKNAHTLSGEELSILNVEYGLLLGQEVWRFMSRHSVVPDFISSHGHTVFHKPAHKMSLQIGSGQHLAVECGLTTVTDFRNKDLALGGQGAPLVPIGDKLLFDKFEFCLNLGGIANISSDDENGHRIAFDICPANFALNHVARQLGKSYDENGDIAATGKLNTDLMGKLDALDYYALPYPKSIANEWIRTTVLPLIDSIDCPAEDKLHTLCVHMGKQVGKAIGDNPLNKVLITGGGAFNRFLIMQIAINTQSGIIVADPLTVNFKEALVFAFLGVLRMRNETNCLATVTGADKDSSCGVVYMP